MNSVRKLFLLSSVIFAMGAVGCGDDDDEGTFDAPVTTFDARTSDAAGDAAVQDAGGDARVTDASTGG